MFEDLPSHFSSPTDGVGFLFWKASNLWQRKQKEALKKFQLTHSQFVLLAGLIYHEKLQLRMTQKDLADFTLTDIMTTSQVLRALEKKGLIVREPHPIDSRAFALKSTEYGQSVLEKSMPLVEEIDQKFFALGEEEKALLLKILQMLLKHH